MRLTVDKVDMGSCLEVYLSRYFAQKMLYKKYDKEERNKKKQSIEESKVLRTDTIHKTSFPGHSSPFRHQSTLYSDFKRNRMLSHMRLPDNPKLVLDFQFNVNTQKAMRSLARQFIQLYSNILDDKDPFHVYFCNFDHQSPFQRTFTAMNINVDNLMVDVRSKHYTDIFPRQDLVYLSPDAKYTLREYNPDKVYIIGMIADNESNHRSYTYAQAKTDKIECLKLPLDQIK
jgi:ribonuclease P protein 1